MKRQDIFNSSVEHLLTQNAKSMDKYKKEGIDGCKFRGKKGMKCAIGHFIPDNMYEKEMENIVGNSIFEKYPRFVKLVGKRNILLLSSLMNVHDGCDVKNWPNALESVAKNYKLKIPIMLQKRLKDEKRSSN